MPIFGKRSKNFLNQSHSDLQTLFNEVIKYIDCSVICGHRSEKEQNKAFTERKSQLKYPLSKHNSLPSLAIDIVPFPIDWENLNRFYFFSGFVLGIAEKLFSEKVITHKIRWGGDWNKNYDITDERFKDLPHFELVPRNSN